MRIAMIGTGYVGLVSGACFSDFGHSVICVDKDKSKIDRLRGGAIPIFEPGLESLVKTNVSAQRLEFTSDTVTAVKNADAVFIAVGTPSRRGDGHADLSYVYKAAEEIALAIDKYTVIVTKSTVPVGTGSEVENVIKRARPDLSVGTDFSVASNPEFLREGAAIDDFKRPDRVVVGADDPRAIEVMREIYRPLFLNETPMLFVGRATSELTKYAANAFLATKISFINEIADLCEKVGANVQEVARGIGLDGRIGSKFLNAGPGYGGSCFPKDTLALTKTAEIEGVPLRIVNAVVTANQQRKQGMANRIKQALDGNLTGKRVAILGLTFKPNTDDMRDSPSLDIVPALLEQGAIVSAHDPEGMGEARKSFDGLNLVFASNPYEAAEKADAVVVLTEWDAYRALDLSRLKEVMRTPVFVDLRNVYNPIAVRKEGFAYSSIGRQ